MAPPPATTTGPARIARSVAIATAAPAAASPSVRQTNFTAAPVTAASAAAPSAKKQHKSPAAPATAAAVPKHKRQQQQPQQQAQRSKLQQRKQDLRIQELQEKWFNREQERWFNRELQRARQQGDAKVVAPLKKCKQQEEQAAQLAVQKQQLEEELARVRNCYHRYQDQCVKKLGSIQQRLKNAQGDLNDTQGRLNLAEGHIEKLRPLAGAGINVLAFARSISKIGRRLFCTHEMIYGGKCGGVRKAVFLEKVMDGLGKPAARPHLAVVKVVDLSGLVVPNVVGINVLDSATEPLYAALGAISFADFLRENPWAADGAGATPGPLDGTTVTNFVNTLGLVLLPCDQKLQDELQAYLNFEKPRRPGKMTLNDEYEFAVKRDELAQQFQLERLKEGGTGSKWCLVMVQPLAEEGSLEQHVLKERGGFHCNPASGGALGIDEYLYVCRHLLTQLNVSLSRHHIIQRDIKSGNLLMRWDLPWVGDWDMAESKESAVWAVENGLATLDRKKFIWGGTRGYAVWEVAALQGIVYTLSNVMEHFPPREAGQMGRLFAIQAGADVGAMVRTLADIWTSQCRWSLVGRNSANELLQGAKSKQCRRLPRSQASAPGDVPAVNYIPEKVHRAMLTALRRKSGPGKRFARLQPLLQAVTEACQERALVHNMTEAQYLTVQRGKAQGHFRVAG